MMPLGDAMNADTQTIILVLSIVGSSLGTIFWLDRKIGKTTDKLDDLRTELKHDIQRVEDKSETAHQSINTKLDNLSNKLSDTDKQLTKQLAALTERVKCVESKIDGRRAEN